MADDLKLIIDIEAILKGMRGGSRLVIRGATIGLAQAMETITNKIRSKILGGQKWDGKAHGKGGGYHPKAYAMAVNIAKREGKTDFRRGRGSGWLRTLKRVLGRSSAVRGSGWKRVLELVPRMAWQRPPSPQQLWIQTGALRKSLGWGMRSRIGLQEGGSPVSSVIGDAIAISYVAIRKDYGGKHEFGRYPFAVPTVRQALADGSVAAIVNARIRKELASRAKPK